LLIADPVLLWPEFDRLAEFVFIHKKNATLSPPGDKGKEAGFFLVLLLSWTNLFKPVLRNHSFLCKKFFEVFKVMV